MESIESQGPTAAIAQSQLDALAPTFYAATNLPENTRLDFLIEGIPESLVDSYKISVHAAATVKSGIARTPPFRQQQGQSYPYGDYRVSISCVSCSDSAAQTTLPTKDAKSKLAQKIYFVGIKDQDYEIKLRNFHEQLRSRSQTEIGEIKQLISTLENQLEETENKFQRVVADLHSNKKTSWPGKSWSAFHPRWLRLEDQLDLASKQPEAHFHSELYDLLVQAERLVSQTHSAQTSYLLAGRESANTESTIDSEASTARDVLRSTRMKILSVENAPMLANGMPRQ